MQCEAIWAMGRQRGCPLYQAAQVQVDGHASSSRRGVLTHAFIQVHVAAHLSNEF